MNIIEKRRNKDLILAFIHMERSAGTTFIHCLRWNFLFRHADVRPLRKKNANIFTSSDFRSYLKINPKIRSIAGHSIVPYSDIKSVYPNVRYVTLLRNPIERYLSHYRYWIQKRGMDLNFKEFLKIEWLKNFQVKKIAGEDNLDEAIRILDNSIWLAGIVEQFNEFMLLLTRKVGSGSFVPNYKAVNAVQKTNENLYDTYQKEIKQQNASDIELYEYVVNNILPKQRLEYGNNFNNDANQLYNLKGSPSLTLKFAADYIFRKFYYQPITGIIRMHHGAPYKGSY